MKQLLDSIENSLVSKNWLSALYMAITLPDICAASENVVSGNGARYKDWFNRYMKKKYDSANYYEYVEANRPERLNELPQEVLDEYKNQPIKVKFTADSCWALRNATLHEGMDEDRLRKFRLTVPDEFNNIHHLTHDETGEIVQIDASIFCQDIIEAVKTWEVDMASRPDVVSKLGKMIRIRDQRFIFD
ncbi:hypothetical protein [Pantoea sp. GbtcB22]|uniref:hypothetical protein n=1 Tax=Pantoea sp. GbtcB22 TaxID=2824767 RepID=UPI001C30FFA8|nr:hypothetical protein [Pantoea sp. GbtcB22]